MGEKLKYIQEFCFINVGIDAGLKEHYKAAIQACEELEDVDFLGLFIPMNEHWNWTYIFRTNSLGKFREFRVVLEDLYGGRPESFTTSLWRFYEKKYDFFNLEKMARKRDGDQHLFTILFQSKSNDIDLTEKHKVISNLFKEKEDVDLLGLYTPKNEVLDWAYFFIANSWEAAAELESEILKILNHPSGSIVTSITRMYEGVKL